MSHKGRSEVGRMVDSSQADDRRLIALVRARRMLYARNNMPVASCYAQVKALWQEVAAEMGWSVADVRRKWSHIRNSYSRHLRNEVSCARTGRGRAVSRWYLADELAFLREHMATDIRAAACSSLSPSLLELAPASPLAAGPLSAGEVPRSPSPLVPKRERSPADASSDVDDDSSYMDFFRGLRDEYSQLRVRRRRLFRRQCLHLLHELLDEQDLAEDTAADETDVDDGDAILPNY